MNNFLLNDALLWDYADGLLDPTAKQQVDAYLKQHPEWKARLEMVLAEKKALFGAHALEKPFPGFADHVMAAWTTGQVEAFAASAKAKGRDWIVYGVAAGFGLFILAPIVAMCASLFQGESIGLSIELPKMPVFDWAALLQLPMLQYAVYLSLTFLAWRLAERVLLRTLAPRRCAAP